MDQFNKKRMKMTNELNMYEKYITDFTRKRYEANRESNLRTKVQLLDP